MRERVAYLRGDHAEEALLVGWICLLAHTLFVPLLALVPAAGYLVAVARAAIEGESTLPPVGFRSILGEGIAASAIALVYGLLPLAIGAITITLAGEATIDPEGGTSLLFLMGSTVTLFVVLVGLYALPIALCRYAVGEVGDMLPDRSFLRIAGHAAYFVGWTSALLLVAVGWLVGGVIEFVPWVGPLLGPLVWWLVALAVTRRLGVAYQATR